MTLQCRQHIKSQQIVRDFMRFTAKDYTSPDKFDERGCDCMKADPWC